MQSALTALCVLALQNQASDAPSLVPRSPQLLDTNRAVRLFYQCALGKRPPVFWTGGKNRGTAHLQFAPMDGAIITSDSDDALDRKKVEWMVCVIGGCLHDREKREASLDTGMVYTVESAEIKVRIAKEGCSDAKIVALMPRYEYEFSKVREHEGIGHVQVRIVNGVARWRAI